jgi:hypothetical protein
MQASYAVRLIVFLGLIAAAWANETLEVLVNAAASFSSTIKQQLEMIQGNPSPADLVEKTIDYAEAKAAYFRALQAELPVVKNVGERSPDLDTFAAALAVAGEEEKKVAEAETLILLKRFSHDPDVARAMLEFQRAQAVERKFHKDYDGLDLKEQ